MPVVVVDTNVLVSGLVTPVPGAPTARIVDGMLVGALPFLLSDALLAEYRRVLVRPGIRARHGLSEAEVSDILSDVVRNARVVARPGTGPEAPAAEDQHLYNLAATDPGAVIVTGDAALLGLRGGTIRAVAPRAFIARVDV